MNKRKSESSSNDADDLELITSDEKENEQAEAFQKMKSLGGSINIAIFVSILSLSLCSSIIYIILALLGVLDGTGRHRFG